MSENLLYWINEGVQLMLTNSGDPLLQIGTGWFNGLAYIMISILGATIAWRGWHGHRQPRGVLQYLGMVFFCSVLLRYYNIPPPGFDNTPHGYITGMGASIARELDVGMTEKVSTRFQNVILGLQAPSWRDAFTNAGAHVHYWLTVLALESMKMVMLLVIMFGWVTAGVLVSMGPLAIPWMIVPGAEWVFWGWLKALIQYSFYPPFAMAYVFVFGHVMMSFFDHYPPPYDAGKLAGMFVVVVGLACCMAFCFFKITSVVAGTFAGRAGEHTLPAVGGWRG